MNTQKSFNFKSIETTPFNSYNRKNIGYLFAIKNGAKFIYDTDDDNEPLVDLNEYLLSIGCYCHFKKSKKKSLIDCLLFFTFP